MFQAELVLEKGHPKPPSKVPGFKRDLHVHRGMCLHAGWCWKMSVPWLRVSTSNIFFSHCLFAVNWSHVLAHPRIMFINRCDDCMMVFVDMSQKDAAHSLLCCAAQWKWVHCSLLHCKACWSGSHSLLVGQKHLGSQQVCVLGGATAQFWPLQQVHALNSHTNTIVTPWW